jgi:2-dehydropantoate 2-reductase
MTTADIMDVVGASRTVGCVIEMAAEIFTPGLVKRHTPAERIWFGLGGMDPVSAGRLAEVEARLRRVGKVTVDILSANG